MSGKRIVITRPKRQSGELIRRLRSLGAECLECPAIKVAPLPLEDFFPKSGVNQRRPEPDCLPFDWIVFLSANAIRYFPKSLKHSILLTTPVCVIGPATKEAARRAGFMVRKMPDQYNTAGVLRVLRPLKGKRILIFRGKGGPQDIIRAMRSQGARVREAHVYETLPAPPPSRKLKDAIIRKSDVIIFASPSAVRCFFGFFTSLERRTLIARAAVLSIGPATTAALRKFQVKKIIQAKQSDEIGMVASLHQYFLSAQNSNLGLN